MDMENFNDEKQYQIILYNDKEHSFLEIISSLITLCDHGVDQADQCALIAHNVGKCSIKVGAFDKMLELKTDLETIGLKVELAEYESSLHK